jgi:membrane associated rhomboid family serine protease
MEKAIGTVRFVIVYFPSGIMGFILGANFAGNGIASTGCSGSLFGIIALVLLVSSPFPRLTGRIYVITGITMNIPNDNWPFY